MALGAPRKALQRIWHGEAERMRAEGLPYHVIATALNVTPAAVYFALNPERRRQYRQKRRETMSRALQSSPA